MSLRRKNILTFAASVIILVKLNLQMFRASTEIYKFEIDENCQRWHQWSDQQGQDQVEFYGEVVMSGIDCVRRCTQLSKLNGECSYVRLTHQILDTEKKLVCEMFSLHGDELVSRVDLPELNISDMSRGKSNLTPTQLIYDPICYAYLYTNETSSSSVFEEDNLTHSTSNWNVYISTEFGYEDTQIPENILSNKKIDVRYKLLFLDDMGLYTVVSLTYMNFSTGYFSAQALDLMEKNQYGFVKVSAKRLMYVGVYSGSVTTLAIDPNGNYVQTTTIPQQFTILREIASEYNISTKIEDSDSAQLKSYLEQGFDIISYEAAIVWTENKISTNSIGNRMNQLKIDGFSKAELPPEYYQRTNLFESFWQLAKQPIGRAGYTVPSKANKVSHLYISPLWKAVFDHLKPTDVQGRLAALSDKINKGHLLRVGFDGRYHDVNDLSIFNDDTYFVLPQQLSLSSNYKFTSNSYGIREVVTLGGHYIRCNHIFEGNSFENQPESGQVRDEVQVFVDTHKWEKIFTVYYDSVDGHHIYGNVSQLADYVLNGRDVTILLTFSGMARYLRMQLLTVQDFNSPFVLVSGESYMSWHLRPETTNQTLTLSAACDMEKVLVSSDGQVEILVYNNGIRKPVQDLDHVASTWFIH